MSEAVYLRKAEFDPKVKTYWLLSGVFLCIVTIVGIPFLIIWVPMALWLTGRFLARMECLLTKKALKVKKGLLVRVEKTIPLEKITDMAMIQGPIMRWLGLYRLTVETAGQSSGAAGGSLVSLVGIVDAQDFREAVLEQRDLITERGARSEQAAPAPAGTAADPTLVDIRDALLRIERLLGKGGDDR
jgi:putative membrane protein